MTYRHRWIIVGILLALLSLASCLHDDPEESDCDEFNPPAKTETYGSRCGVFSYGSCPKKFDDCKQGTCQASTSGFVCTASCTSDSQCPGSLPYCLSGVCTAACKSHTFCDGTTCCSYVPDPNNPTRCKQASCSLS